MIVACEDALSEAVIRKLVQVVRPDIAIQVVLGLRGKGYLEAKARQFNRTARNIPVFLLVDADTPNPCPSQLKANWLGGHSEPYMLFRVAVFEVESWILADRKRCAEFLAVPLNRIPLNTDSIPDPKRELVNVARRSRRRDIKLALVPAHGATNSVGPEYNSRLAGFVAEHWEPLTAAQVSPSLSRAIARLADI